MKLKLNKETWFVIGFTPIVLAVVIFIFMAGSGSDSENNAEKKQGAVSDINSDPLLKKLYEKDNMEKVLSKEERLAIYEKDREKYGFNHLSDEGFSSKKSEERKEVIKAETKDLQPVSQPAQVIKTKSNNSTTVVKKSSQPAISTSKQEEIKQPEAPQEEPVRRQSGFYSSKGNKASNNSADLIHAVVHNDHSLKNGSTVRLRITEETTIDGNILPKNSYVSGIANFTSERCRILITSINYGGKIIKTNLTAFDLDGIEGVYVPGGISEEIAKDGVNEGIRTTTTVNVPIIGNVSTNALSKKANDPVVNIKSGYKLLFKSQN